MNDPGLRRTSTGSASNRRETATGELVKRRRSRDLWISRSHLYAVVALVVVSSATFFLAGFVVGRRLAPDAPPTVGMEPGDEELLKVLTTIERGTHPESDKAIAQGAAPLEGGDAQGPRVAPVGVAPAPAVTLAPSPGAVEAAGTDAPPAGPYTLVVLEAAARPEVEEVERVLTERGLSAWSTVALVDGVAVYRVAVGNFATPEAAALASPVLQAAGFTGRVAPIE
jgi:SPOR domain